MAFARVLVVDPVGQVSEGEIKQAQKAEREAEKMKGLMRARFDFLDLD